MSENSKTTVKLLENCNKLQFQNLVATDSLVYFIFKYAFEFQEFDIFFRKKRLTLN